MTPRSVRRAGFTKSHRRSSTEGKARQREDRLQEDSRCRDLIVRIQAIAALCQYRWASIGISACRQYSIESRIHPPKGAARDLTALGACRSLHAGLLLGLSRIYNNSPSAQVANAHPPGPGPMVMGAGESANRAKTFIVFRQVKGNRAKPAIAHVSSGLFVILAHCISARRPPSRKPLAWKSTSPRADISDRAAEGNNGGSGF